MNIHDIKKVYYHASCPDGTASAILVAAEAYEQKAQLKASDFISVQYSSPELMELTPETGQLFVDITPPKERWKEWVDSGVVVLDHHETAKEITVGLNGSYGTNDSWSGARLVYEHILTNKSPEWDYFSRVAMVRDTWKKDHPEWKDACTLSEALTFLGAKECISMALEGNFDIPGVMSIGSFLMKSIEAKIKKYSKGVISYDFSGYKIGVFNCTEKLISEVGNALIESGFDMAVGVFFSSDKDGPFYIISLRSNERVSSRKIAESFGGGGHDRAAGFRINGALGLSLNQVVNIIQDRIISYNS